MIRERLISEAETNVAIRITESANRDAMEVAGRGELQLGVLIETMRREGFELSVSRPRVLFQLVPEAKTVKNRVHLDLRPGPDGTEAIVARLDARGATELHRGAQGPHHWVTMADPEGNEFCVG